MRDESGDLGWRLEGHHENHGPQIVYGCSLLAQLREMLSAGQSTQPAQEDQNHRLTPPRREGNSFPFVVPKRQRGNPWQCVRHPVDPLPVPIGELCRFGPQPKAQHRQNAKDRSGGENRKRERPSPD